MNILYLSVLLTIITSIIATGILTNSVQKKKKTVLIADSSSKTLALLGRILKDNYNVITPPDGITALLKYQKNRENIGLVITGKDMLYMDGDELTQAIREYDKTLPILMTSAGLTEDEIKRSLSNGVTSHLIPINPTELKNEVQELLKRQYVS